MSNLILKEFNGSSVRMHLDAEGNPWFSAKDVCGILGISNSRDALSRLSPDDVGNTDAIDTIGREVRAKIVNESGLYALVFTSRKATALAFQRWVTKEVLPSIRKTGVYMAGQGEWLTARSQGKLVRKIQTDIIQTFIDYAKGQGSRSADMYFMNFSKMVNSALLEVDGPKPKNLRDSLNVIQLNQVAVAETIVTRSIMELIAKQLPYKEIYQIAKKRIETYAQSVGRSRLGQTERQTMGLLA